jgi:hypothetical protein
VKLSGAFHFSGTFPVVGVPFEPTPVGAWSVVPVADTVPVLLVVKNAYAVAAVARTIPATITLKSRTRRRAARDMGRLMASRP